MNTPFTRAGPARRLVPRSAASALSERLTNWLALMALLALGIVWQ